MNMRRFTIVGYNGTFKKLHKLVPKHFYLFTVLNKKLRPKKEKLYQKGIEMVQKLWNNDIALDGNFFNE